MKFYDICTKKSFEKNGETKVTWLKAGTLRETDDGKKFIELNHLPETSFYCFEQKPKESGKPVEKVMWDE